MESPQPPSPPPSLLRRLIKIDTAISLLLHNLTQPILPRPFLKLLEISGDGRLFFPVIISVLLSSSSPPLLRTFLLNLLIGGLLDLIIIGLTKHLVRRPRPVYNKHMSLTFSVDHWSFPSGHSSRVCLIACFFYLNSPLVTNLLGEWRGLGLNLGEVEGANVFVVTIICLWAVVTSVSRVLLGRHFVFDVVAGAMFGIFEALVVVRFLNCSLLSAVFDYYFPQPS